MDTMTKVINLDKLETKKDRAVILNGKEHVMATLTVKDYIHQLKQQAEIDKLSKEVDGGAGLEAADKIMEVTIEALGKLFPTIMREELEALTMEQLTAMRELAEEEVEKDAPEAEATGE